MTVAVRAEVATGLLEVLSRRVGRDLEFAGEPASLSGGFWAELVSFRLADPPDGWPVDLVARVMPDPATAAKETAFQAGVAEQDRSTPAVLAAGGPADGIDGQAWLVMPLAPGRPLLDGLDGIGALRKLPSLLRGMPVTLADVTVALHRLDPAPVRERLAASGVPIPDIDAMLEHLRATAKALGRDDLVSAIDRLEIDRPEAVAEVVCHGDLHPFNVLIDERGTTTVLDWSTAVLGSPDHDLGFTSLLLAQPPLTVPGPLRPLLGAAGRVLSHRFLRAYERASGRTVHRGSLAWHQDLTCVRALVEVAGWVAAGTIADRAGHPWVIAGEAFAGRLTRRAGATVRAR